MSPFRLIPVAGATLAAACALTAPLAAAPVAQQGCARAGYSYAGVHTPAAARGMAATISPVRLTGVTSGHVAAWVGVGGAGMGAKGLDEWLQIGVSSMSNGATELYYEVTLPGQKTSYTSLQAVAEG